MALIARPSLQGKFSLVYSEDPSMQPRPPDLPVNATEAEKKDRISQQERHDHALQVCRETGNWDGLLIEGAPAPTVFVFELPRGEKGRMLRDLVQKLALNDKTMTLTSKLFRATCHDIVNWPGPEVSRVTEDGVAMISADIVEFLDEQITPRIVMEFAPLIADRLRGSSGK